MIPTKGCELSSDELDAFCKGQIAHYKIPKYWLWTESFPLTVTGKPLKYVLQELANEQLFGKK